MVTRWGDFRYRPPATAAYLVERGRADGDAWCFRPFVALPVRVAAPLFFESFVLASSGEQPLRMSPVDEWTALDPVDCLVLPEGHCLRSQVIAACSDVVASHRHATSLETMKYMVAAGKGCTQMPALARL